MRVLGRPILHGGTTPYGDSRRRVPIIKAEGRAPSTEEALASQDGGESGDLIPGLLGFCEAKHRCGNGRDGVKPGHVLLTSQRVNVPGEDRRVLSRYGINRLTR
eukprot:3040837-Amphidinium_carterae.1